jgi:hypothetical protein
MRLNWPVIGVLGVDALLWAGLLAGLTRLARATS